jgi:dTDP-4-amino-4,6-dideoxygalactose transaminase
MQYPLLLASSQERDQFSAYLRKNKISTASPYRDIVAIAAEQYGYSGGCLQAERIAETVLVVPCNYALKPSEVEMISTSMNGAWNDLVTRRRSADASSISVSGVSQQERGILRA